MNTLREAAENVITARRQGVTKSAAPQDDREAEVARIAAVLDTLGDAHITGHRLGIGAALYDAGLRVLDSPEPEQWWQPAEGPDEEMVCGRCDQRIPNGTPATYVLAHAERCLAKPVPLELRDDLLAWVRKQRATPWSEGSFASRMTGEQGYDAALEELEVRLR